MATKKVVFVIGATGNVGSATLQALSGMYDPATTTIKAGVRSPEKATELAALPGVEVVQAEMGNPALSTTLVGVDALFIVAPGSVDRAVLCLKTMESAKAAGVKFILQLSVLTVATDTIFGRQFKFVEDGIKMLGVPYACIRLPLFMENYWAFKDPIVGQGMIYNPVDPTKPYTPVAVADVAKASAMILLDPSKHISKTYNLSTPPHSFQDVADLFTKSMGKEVKYVQVPYSAAKEAFMGMGFPEWQVDGIMELYHMIDNQDPVYSLPNDYTTVTGETPTDAAAFIGGIAPYFK